MSQRICSILDCGRPARSNGMCVTHDGNKRRYGHAVPVRDWPLIALLVRTGWDVDARGCWIWRGSRNDFGYGTLTSARNAIDSERVHRLMWEMHNGPIPDGLVVRHRCDNPPCVNPDHLATGTKQQNSLDMVERERGMAYASGRYGGVCKAGRHDLSLSGALKTVRRAGKNPYLTCVGCDVERKRKFEAKKKAARKAAGKKAA